MILHNNNQSLLLVKLGESDWFKCNTDGVSKGLVRLMYLVVGYLSCFHCGLFLLYLGAYYALYAEVVGVILAMEVAVSKDLTNLWIVQLPACYSSLIQYFYYSLEFRSRWLNCFYTQ